VEIVLKKIFLFFEKRYLILVSICVVTPLGFWCKFYDGPGKLWFNNYGGGVLYEIFWCLVFFLIRPTKKNATRIAVAVLAVTCILETLQLWQPAFLQQIRATFAGKALLGTTFVWWDFPHYILGCLLAWLWMTWIVKLVGNTNPG